MLNPQILGDLETQMQAISEVEYAAVTKKLWWPLVMKVRKTSSRKAVLAWLLAGAKIRSQERGGKVTFDDLAVQFTEIESMFSGAGLSLRESELSDARGPGDGVDGFDLALEWAQQISGSIAYWPQEQAALVLKNGHLLDDAGGFTAYDGKPFFATDHLLNPYRSDLGTYSNLFAGADAAPIDETVTLDVARSNLARVYGLIGSVKMSHGEGLRCLRPRALLVPPSMFPRAAQLTGALSLSLDRVGESGSDVVGMLNALGFAAPVMASEFSGYEDEKTYFVAAEQVSTSALGAVVLTEREPHRIMYYGRTAKLSRSGELEWHAKGRNKVAAGHPFLLFKVKAT